ELRFLLRRCGLRLQPPLPQPTPLSCQTFFPFPRGYGWPSSGIQPGMRDETNGACSACGGLVVPLVLPDKAAPSTPGDPPRPWDFTSVVAHVSLPLPTFLCNEEARGASGPDPLEVSLADPRAGRAPGAPLRDSLNHLNLPPLLALPTRWPPILGADGAQAPGHLPGAERAPRTPGGFRTPAALARHQQLHCHLQAQRCFTCKFCDKELEIHLVFPDRWLRMSPERPITQRGLSALVWERRVSGQDAMLWAPQDYRLLPPRAPRAAGLSTQAELNR
ncbi:hypothetical protein E2I00_019647, partial [Balaenoptera physalus]